jgi:hypothetical protein
MQRLAFFSILLGLLIMVSFTMEGPKTLEASSADNSSEIAGSHKPLDNINCGPQQNNLSSLGKPSPQANWLASSDENNASLTSLPYPFDAAWIEGQAVQGEAALIWLRVDPGTVVQGQLKEQSITFYPYCNLFWGLLAFDALHDDPGLQDLTLHAVDYGTTAIVPINLLAGDFWSGPPVIFPPDKQELLRPERLNAENEYLNNLLSNLSADTAYWKGPFQLPRNASRTSGFGARGVVNGVATGYHKGVDYRGFVGTPFFAPAPGYVILAEALTVRGNVIFIDHGAGVSTGYFHASEINVSVGDRVETGDLLGKIGVTGLTTGAHLHWEMRVNGIPVNPHPWLKGAIPVSAQELGAADWAFPWGHFYTQTAKGQGGYAVVDDRNARMLSHFLQLGGLQTVGYPISRRYILDGFLTQAFQKMVLQWRPEVGEAWPTNVFDNLSKEGYDNRLFNARQVPYILEPNFDSPNASWSEIVANRQGLLEANTAIGERYFSVTSPLTVFGLPTSQVIDMGNHFALRTQRAVLQQWKENVPWAAAGQVTIANGGDISKELGALPASALQPDGIPNPNPNANSMQPSLSEWASRRWGERASNTHIIRLIRTAVNGRCWLRTEKACPEPAEG